MLEIDQDVHITRKLRKQLNMSDVSMRIEEIKSEFGYENYRESCIHFLEEIPENLDFPDLAKLLSPTLKDKMKTEAINEGFIRGGGRENKLDELFAIETTTSQKEG